MSDRHFGFRVSGISPLDESNGFVSDLFELRQVAIECARMLETTGWTRVKCEAIGENHFGPCANAIDFRERVI
jgi:hypothetical protein